MTIGFGEVTIGLQSRRRILVLGSGGAGKSTFATQLGERLRLPVIHLDRYFWSAGWQPTPEAAWQQQVQSLASQDAWVMDGNFSGSLPFRLARSDAVVFLDLSRWACLRGVLARWLQYRGRSRPDLAEGCPEKLDLEFLRWVWDFPERSRPGVLAALTAAAPSVAVWILTRRSQTRPLLETVPSRRIAGE